MIGLIIVISQPPINVTEESQISGDDVTLLLLCNMSKIQCEVALKNSLERFDYNIDEQEFSDCQYENKLCSKYNYTDEPIIVIFGDKYPFIYKGEISVYDIQKFWRKIYNSIMLGNEQLAKGAGNVIVNAQQIRKYYPVIAEFINEYQITFRESSENVAFQLGQQGERATSINLTNKEDLQEFFYSIKKSKQPIFKFLGEVDYLAITQEPTLFLVCDLNSDHKYVEQCEEELRANLNSHILLENVNYVKVDYNVYQDFCISSLEILEVPAVIMMYEQKTYDLNTNPEFLTQTLTKFLEKYYHE